MLCGTEERGREGVSSMRCVHYLYISHLSSPCILQPAVPREDSCAVCHPCALHRILLTERKGSRSPWASYDDGRSRAFLFPHTG